LPRFSRSTRRPPISTLFPYTTLFRSGRARHFHRLARLGPKVSIQPWIGRHGAHGGDMLPGNERGMAAAALESGDPNARLAAARRSEEHTSELQSPDHLVCRLLLEKKK